MNPVWELCKSTLETKMLVRVGENSTEEMMFHLDYKQYCKAEVVKVL